MEPRSAAEILLSPEGLLVLPFFAIIDITGIILVCFALDDFWITDIIAWGFYGLWSTFRWKTRPAEIQTPSMGAKKEWAKEIKAGKAAQEAAKAEKAAQAEKTAQEAAKAGKTAQEGEKTAQEAAKAEKAAKAARGGKRLKFFEFIPYVGALPLWTISVYMEMKYS